MAVGVDRLGSKRRLRAVLLLSTSLGIALALTAIGTTPAAASDILVSDASQLSAAIAGAAAGDRILLQNNIALGTTLLPPVAANITIDGNGHTIDAQGNNRIFFLNSTATIQNVTLVGGNAQGGAGGSGAGKGGGGLGAGGAIFVNTGNATISNVSFANNSAVGGNAGGSATGGGTPGGGGGGGLGGSGGNAGQNAGGGGGGYSGGGGGSGGPTDNGSLNIPGGAGGSGPGGSGGNGGMGTSGSPGANGGGAGGASGVRLSFQTGGGGGGGGIGGGAGGSGTSNDIDGGGGGGGGGLAAGTGGTGGTHGAGTNGGIGGGGGGAGGNGGGNAGNGGDFGGGGGGTNSGNPGNGGFGGGGGGTGYYSTNGGAGGFGGGGGGTQSGPSAGAGGVGGGNGSGNSGGGGAGFGGAVFVRGGASLTVSDGSFTGNSVTAGASGSPISGAAAGSSLFLMSGTTTTFSPTGTLTINGTIADDSAASVAAGQSFAAGTGAGAAIAIASGTVVLNGANTYSGGTTIDGTAVAGNNSAFGTGTVTIDGGTLQAGANNLTISNAIALSRSGGTVDTNSNTLTLSGVIVDAGASPGALTKAGAGTLILIGANTYSGGTTINTGTLKIAGAGTLGASSATTTVAGGTLDLGGTTQIQNGGVMLTGGRITNGTLSSSGVFGVQAGAIDATLAGSGALTKSGAGMVTLSGINTFTGSTTVNAGTLVVASGGSIGSAAGPTSDATVANGATFENAGTVVTGLLTNNGTVTVDAGGALTANSGIANHGTFTNNGTVTDDLANTGLYTNNAIENANVASNIGAIVNSAGANWNGNFNTAGVVDNEGTINGSLTQTAGTTTNNGSITGAVIVSGGLFTGAGSLGGLTIASGASFRPGSGVAGTTTTVNGDLTLSAGSTYVVNVNPATASKAIVNGTATLGGTVNAVYASGRYISKQYTILTATGGLGGTTFSGLTNTNLPSSITDSLSYDANNAYLDLVLNFSIPGGLNRNQQSVANALTNYFNTSDGIPVAFGALSPAGLAQVDGELATGVQRVTFDAMNQFMGVMADPSVGGWGTCDIAKSGRRNTAANPGCDVNRWTVWGSAYGAGRNTDGNAAIGSSDVSSHVWGLAVGANYRFSPDTVAGFATGGGATGFGLGNGMGSGRSDLFQAGAFVHHAMGPAYITGTLAYGWQDVTTDRSVAGQLHANFNANALSGRLESGWRFDAPGGIGLTPYAAGQFTGLFLPGYSEHAQSGDGTFALNYDSKTESDSRVELGLRADKSFVVEDGVVTLGSRLAWAHNFTPTPSATASFQALPGSSFTVDGASIGHDAALTSVSAEMKWRDGWAVGASFDSAFSGQSQTYGGKGTLRYQW